MKRNNIKSHFIACAALVFLMTGCDNADYKILDNAIYFSEAGNTNFKKITADPENITTTSLNIRLAEALTEDVEATIVVDPSILEEYNTTNSTSYEVLPEKYYAFDKEIKIKAGDVSTEATNFSIKPYVTPNGESYAIPISISVTKGNISTIGTSGKYLILLNQPLIQAVPVMNWKNHPSTDKEKKWNESVTEYSLEFWVQMDGFKINNQAIFNSEDIYIRFGDAMIDYDLLQIKTLGSQVNTVTHFLPNKWYHVAFVHDSSGLLTIYINGVKDVTLQTKGGPLAFTFLEMVCSGSTYFKNNCKLAQVRLWRKAITPIQINSNMYYAVKSTDPTLMGYWKLDEGQGGSFKDCTGQGRDMIVENELKWENNVRFDK